MPLINLSDRPVYPYGLARPGDLSSAVVDLTIEEYARVTAAFEEFEAVQRLLRDAVMVAPD